MTAELREQRFISGKGLLKIPASAAKSRYFLLYADVIRRPSNEYLNLNYNPPRSRYATLVFLRGNYVVQEASLDYPRQRWEFVSDPSGQTLIAVKCAYEGILISFASLATGLALPIAQYQDLIKDYENLSLVWDEVRVVCYADTAIRLSLYSAFYATCDPEKDDQDEGGPPPPPPPSVPPGVPIEDGGEVELSEPYDYPNDGGNTQPYPGDEVPPEFEECSAITITLNYVQTLDNTPIPKQLVIPGKAPFVTAELDEFVSGGSSIFVTDAFGPNDRCVPNTRRRVNRGVGTFSDLTFSVSQ